LTSTKRFVIEPRYELITDTEARRNEILVEASKLVETEEIGSIRVYLKGIM
jgi:hypothetical protein